MLRLMIFHLKKIKKISVMQFQIFKFVEFVERLSERNRQLKIKLQNCRACIHASNLGH